MADVTNNSSVVDLTNNSEFTMLLLDDTWAWRQRLIEQLEFGSGDHVRVSSSYQVEIPSGLAERFLDGSGASRIKALVPLTTRQKRSLLDFDLNGPEGENAHLMLRSSIAAIQAEYLARLAASSPPASRQALTDDIPDSLLEAICVFSPALFEFFAAEYGNLRDALRAYLTDGLGYKVGNKEVTNWYAAAQEAARHLVDALEEPAERHSSSELILLALPLMDPRPSTPAEAERVVYRFRDAVKAAFIAGDSSFLSALAEYGRRWEVIVEAELPLDEPVTIRLVESRPLGLDLSRRGWTRQIVALGDASSGHIEARVLDTTVIIDRYTVTNLRGKQVAIPPLEDARHTDEALSLYSSDPDRPYYVEVGLRFRVVPYVRYTILLTAAITWFAVLAALFVDDNQLVAALAILTVPTTLAATLVGIREQTPLAAKLQSRARLNLGAAIAVLWVVALARLLSAGTDTRWLETLLSRLRPVVRTVWEALGLLWLVLRILWEARGLLWLVLRILWDNNLASTL
jgi:hypothetical protein